MVDRPSRRAAVTATRRISYAVDSDTDDGSVSGSDGENKNVIQTSKSRKGAVPVSPTKATRRASSPPATPRRSSRRESSGVKGNMPSTSSTTTRIRVEIPVNTDEWPHLDLDEDGFSSATGSPGRPAKSQAPKSSARPSGVEKAARLEERTSSRAVNKSSRQSSASAPSKNSAKRKRAKIESDDDYEDDVKNEASDDDDEYEDLKELGDEAEDDDDDDDGDAAADEDAFSDVSEEKPKSKAKAKARANTARKATGGVSNAARKKASAASAEAGNLPPMSDLNEMFRDMLTRKPESDDVEGDDKPNSSSSSGKGKQKTLFDMLGGKGKAKEEATDPQEGVFSEPKGVYLRKAVQQLGRKLRVATMCR